MNLALINVFGRYDNVISRILLIMIKHKKGVIMKVLLVEDDEKLGLLIEHFLKEEKFKTDWVKNGKDAIYYAQNENYDIIILDWMLPKEDGIEVCQRLRKENYDRGIIMLTAKDTVEDKVKGLEVGADDYLVKPFAFEELLARIKAVLRRSEHKFQDEFIKVGGLELNITSCQVKFKNFEIILTNREYQLLETLMINAGNTVRRELLFERVWGAETEVSANNLEVYINILRKKLEYFAGAPIIKTIRGIGYRLE